MVRAGPSVALVGGPTGPPGGAGQRRRQRSVLSCHQLLPCKGTRHWGERLEQGARRQATASCSSTCQPVSVTGGALGMTLVQSGAVPTQVASTIYGGGVWQLWARYAIRRRGALKQHPPRNPAAAPRSTGSAGAERLRLLGTRRWGDFEVEPPWPLVPVTCLPATGTVATAAACLLATV